MDTATEDLSPKLAAFATQLADEVAQRVRDELDAPEPGLMDATATARLLGVDRKLIYDLARTGRLPCFRLGDGERARLRFDRAAVLEHLAGNGHTNGSDSDG